ncbi:hypothetical protein COCCADRAFT_100699 [Bipolaris zeicola 26-R-13]|uniref:Uncharacterized protein n=1 Tax=Cochliobolus carbonum (strain 26-R-13) TaxID=930089 RepID=W6YK81_COCC2|nr:uncharacterized protein COCCADRAFT_100699 [Bipolaris zeicola 26-R-13]EUC31666.1 hypothetical protein COCCADRAFT_100699 [Bipolaris zeicola 26-R-13]
MTLCGHDFPSDCCCAVQAGFQQDTCLLSCRPEESGLSVYSTVIQTYIISIAACVGHGIQGSDGTRRKFLEHDPLPAAKNASSDKRPSPYRVAPKMQSRCSHDCRLLVFANQLSKIHISPLMPCFQT